MKARAKTGMKVLDMLYPIICDSSIPMTLRLKLLKGIVIPILTFGAAILPKSLDKTAPLQRVVDRGLKALIRIKRESNFLASDVFWEEFSIARIRHSWPPLYHGLTYVCYVSGQSSKHKHLNSKENS